MLKDLKSLNIPLGLPRWLSANNQLAIAEDMGSIPDVERSLGEGNGDLLQYSCLEIFLTCSTQESPPPVSLLSLTPSQKNVTLKDGCGHLSLVLTTEEDGTVTLLNHCANPEISSLSPSD